MNRAIRPLKRFGQHFLIDDNIIKKIMTAAALHRDDCVFEVGPGRGALTSEISGRVKRLLALEIDRGLCQELKDRFSSKKNTEIVCGDVLRFDLRKYARRLRIKKFKVLANLPYYITTPVIGYFFKNIKFFDDIFITVQEEVARRMVAKPGQKAYGSFTCFVDYFCSPMLLFKIKSGSFWPAPKVDSCFMRLKPKGPHGRPVRARSEALLFRVIRSAFGQRRKKLYTSLSGILERKELNRLPDQEILSCRPEELSLAEFVDLSNLLFDFLKKR